MKHKPLQHLLMLLCAGSVALMIYVLTSTPAFTPPPFDPAAQQGIPSDVPGFELLDAQAFQVGFLVSPKLEETQLEVCFANPEANTCNLRLRILDDAGNVLGQSGLIRPGEFIQSVTLDTIPQANMPLILKLMAYEPETYHSAGAVTATVNLQIPQT